MKILVVSPCPTHPNTAGNRNLQLAYCSLLSDLGHDVYFLFVSVKALHDKNHGFFSVDEMKEYWGDHFFQYDQTLCEKFVEIFYQQFRRKFRHGYMKVDDQYPSGLSKYVNLLNSKIGFNACIVNYYYMSKLLEDVKIQKRALFTHDYFAFKDKLVHIKNVGHMCTPNDEAKACQRAPYIFAMQDEEAAYYSKIAPESRVLLNYTICKYQSSPICNNHKIVFFSGGNQYNQEGFSWFMDKVYPLIEDAFPDVQLVIGGGICNVLSNYSLPSSVEIIGMVDNPGDVYKLGDVAINPTMSGTGLKIKTFESVSYDKVTIVHPHSVIGIFDKEKAPLLVSDEPKKWVEFLFRIWNEEGFIQLKKSENKVYIDRMNNFVKNQFELFIDHKDA